MLVGSISCLLEAFQTTSSFNFIKNKRIKMDFVEMELCDHNNESDFTSEINVRVDYAGLPLKIIAAITHFFGSLGDILYLGVIFILIWFSSKLIPKSVNNACRLHLVDVVIKYTN